MTEEVASMNSLLKTTTAEDIFFSKTLRKHLIHYGLKYNLLISVTTDDGRNMCGAEKDLIGQIYKAYENIRCLKPVVIHCIHQQGLWKAFESVMSS